MAPSRLSPDPPSRSSARTFPPFRSRIDAGLLLVRIGLGISFVFLHGAPKLLGGPETWIKLGGAMGALGITAAPAFWGFMAAFAEGIGGLLVALGLAFRPALVLLVVTMLVAALAHVVQFGDGLVGASQAPELAVVFAGLLLTGPGRYALDARLGLEAPAR